MAKPLRLPQQKKGAVNLEGNAMAAENEAAVQVAVLAAVQVDLRLQVVEPN